MAAHIPQEFSNHPRPGAIHFKFQTKIQRKSAIFDPFFTKYFVLAISF